MGRVAAREGTVSWQGRAASVSLLLYAAALAVFLVWGNAPPSSDETSWFPLATVVGIGAFLVLGFAAFALWLRRRPGRRVPVYVAAMLPSALVGLPLSWALDGIGFLDAPELAAPLYFVLLVVTPLVTLGGVVALLGLGVGWALRRISGDAAPPRAATAP